jgi:hypothetical protein
MIRPKQNPWSPGEPAVTPEEPHPREMIQGMVIGLRSVELVCGCRAHASRLPPTVAAAHAADSFCRHDAFAQAASAA